MGVTILRSELQWKGLLQSDRGMPAAPPSRVCTELPVCSCPNSDRTIYQTDQKDLRPIMLPRENKVFLYRPIAPNGDKHTLHLSVRHFSQATPTPKGQTRRIQRKCFVSIPKQVHKKEDDI